MARDLKPGPFGRLLGIEVVEQREGYARALLRASSEHLNPHGVVHGGAVYSLIDQAMGAAVYTVLEPGELCATITITIAYLEAARPEEITAEVRLVRRTRRLAVLEGEARQGTHLLAKAAGTYAIFAGEMPAEGPLTGAPGRTP
mgnify:CR=1 FL=1